VLVSVIMLGATGADGMATGAGGGAGLAARAIAASAGWRHLGTAGVRRGRLLGGAAPCMSAAAATAGGAAAGARRCWPPAAAASGSVLQCTPPRRARERCTVRAAVVWQWRNTAASVSERAPVRRGQGCHGSARWWSSPVPCLTCARAASLSALGCAADPAGVVTDGSRVRVCVFVCVAK
jgi:hypothetical protein